MEWIPIQADATPIPLLGEYLVFGREVSLEQDGAFSQVHTIEISSTTNEFQTFRLSRVTVLLGVFIATDYRAHYHEDLAFRKAYYGARCVPTNAKFQ
eukprot:9453260-Pyramimonas_sp.AAC.1